MNQEEFNINMQERLNEVEETLKLLLSKMTSLYSKLVGDELTPVGFIKEFEDLKKEVKELKDFKNKIIWSISLAAVGGGIAGYLLQVVLSYVKK